MLFILCFNHNKHQNKLFDLLFLAPGTGDDFSARQAAAAYSAPSQVETDFTS